MRSSPRTALVVVLLALSLPFAAAGQTVRRVQVLGSKNSVEIDIEGSDRLTPQTRVLTGPDRLVVDFPNAVPSRELRNQPVNRGEVKDVRVGLFQSNPPVTRVVLDLKSAQSFQVFPYGRTVIVKVSEPKPDISAGVEDFPSEQRAGLVNASYPAGAAMVSTAPAALPTLQVTFQNGLLAIRANKASLSELLFAVHQRTGAEVSIASGAEQEKVVADLGPAPASEVLAHLLNGSKFNFLILSSPRDPRALERVILSPRSEGGPTPLPQMQANVPAQEDLPQGPPAENIVQPQPGQAQGNQPGAPTEADDTRN